MALATTNPHNEVVIGPVPMADISAGGHVYAASPVTGKIVRMYSVLKGTITGANVTWQLRNLQAADAIPNSVTVAFSGSANGDVDGTSVNPYGVSEGDALRFTSLGESSTTVAADFYAVIRV